MEEISVGIDVGADEVAICVLDAAGRILTEFGCSSLASSVIERLGSARITPPAVIALEAGSYGTLLTRELRAAGYTVRVFETRYASGFLKLKQNKTDRNDARGIAELARLGAPCVPETLVKSEEVQILRSQLVLRHQMIVQRVALENALRGTFRLNGGKLPRLYSGTHLERAAHDELARLREQGRDISEIVVPVLALAVAMRKTLERIDRRLAHRAEDMEVCDRLMSIPGVGCICALSFYTAIEDPHRFERSSDVGPYLGLVPKVSQSGSMLRMGRISRRGNTMTRTHLVSAAGSHLRQGDKDSELRRWAVRLGERAGRGKARVALARKIATVMIAMWKSGETFRLDSADTGP